MNLDNFISEKLEKLTKKFEFFGRRLIEVEGSPYLLRVYLLPRLNTAGILPAIYLHRFYRSDKDRELHNHPWKLAISFILSGGYQEERLVDDDVKVFSRKPFSFNFITEDTFHKVTLNNEEQGCWTLFIPFKRVKDWGFLDHVSGNYYPWELFTAKAKTSIND